MNLKLHKIDVPRRLGTVNVQCKCASASEMKMCVQMRVQVVHNCIKKNVSVKENEGTESMKSR